MQSLTVWEFLLDTFDLFQNLDVCYSFIFSGHTGSALIWATVWVIYCKNFVLRVMGTLLTGVVIFFISFDRLHYTVDIVLGLIITFNIILIYHLVAYIDELQKFVECQSVDFVETSSKEFEGAIQDTSATDSTAKFTKIPSSAAFVALLVRIVRWVDAKHLESSNEERQKLLT